jgi:hypothetical protein
MRKVDSKECPDCGEICDMYYRAYCPKCDIQDIIKHKRGSLCLIPILNYGKKYIKGFDKDTVWDDISDNIHGNDSYYEHYIDKENSEVGKMLYDVLTEIGYDFNKKGYEVLFWISW